MILLRLFCEYFKVGLFSVGGGLATLPFLADMSERTGWFTAGELADMVAVAESTPGPLGVNMAAYVGFRLWGIPGSIVAVLGLIAPSILVVLVVAGFLQKFRQSRTVEAVFRGLRPASTGLMAFALLQVCSIALVNGGGETLSIRWGAVILAVLVFAALQEKHLKKIHPIVFILLSAGVGILFKM